MKSIVEQVFDNASKTPKKIALTDGKKSLSFAELKNEILYSKIVLEEKYKLKQGDATIIAANKQLSFVSAYFACHLLGIIALPIAPDTNPKRFRMIYNKVAPKLVIGFESEIVNCEIGNLEEFVAPDGYDSTVEYSFPSMDILADIIFTTGTTGEPKGVQLTHNNIAAAALNINTFIQNTSDDVEMLALPISHSFGLGRLRCAMSNGQTVVILGSFANMKRFFRYMEEFSVTGFGMVPSSWALIKKLSGTKIKEYAGQLKYIEIGSAPMPIDDKKLLIDILPKTRICMHYGLTEASRSCFMEFHESMNYLNTVGKQSPNMYVKILDEDGVPVKNGIEGEICVKGLAVTPGYYQLDEVNSTSYFGEYFRTGDWGIRDDDGRIILCSRKKELINVGGKKVSPMEVEEVLNTIDFIKESVCVGIPDPDGVLGEIVKAYIVTDSPEKVMIEKIRESCNGKLEDYKIPIECEIIDAVPKTSSGKVQRLSLKK